MTVGSRTWLRIAIHLRRWSRSSRYTTARVPRATRAAERSGAFANSSSSRGQLVEAEVVDLDELELLEVRVRVAPAAPLIEPDAVREHLAQGALGLLEVEALERRLEQPLGADLRRCGRSKPSARCCAAPSSSLRSPRRRRRRARRGSRRGSG